MIKNVILDIGNVLVDFRYKELIEDLNISESASKTIISKCVENSLWNELDLGIIPEQQIYDKMLEAVGEYGPELQKFLDNLIDVVKTYPYTVSWITNMKEKGLKVYLLSNYPKTWFELHEKERFGFTHLVDGKVVSAFVKMAKPDKRIYEYLMDTYDIKAEESIFFDDKVENVEAAKQLGINGHVFTDYEAALEIMARYGL